MRVTPARMTTRGRVTVPVAIRRSLGWKPGQKFAFIEEDGRVRLEPEPSVTAATAGIFKSVAPPLSPREEKALAEQVMADEAAYEGL